MSHSTTVRYPSLTPRQHPPPPPPQRLDIVVSELLPAVLDLGNEPLKTAADGAGDAQRDLVREDVEHGKNEEGEGAEPGAVGGGENPGDEALALLEGVLGPVGRSVVVVGAAAEEFLDKRDKGGAGRVGLVWQR